MSHIRCVIALLFPRGPQDFERAVTSVAGEPDKVDAPKLAGRKVWCRVTSRVYNALADLGSTTGR